MKKKYVLTKKSIKVFGKKLFQIKSLKEFSNVKKGGLGGYIEKEDNLDQEGDAWVYGDARVYGDAWVYGNLKIKIGFYFGMQYKKEKILKKKTEDGDYILWKKWN